MFRKTTVELSSLDLANLVSACDRRIGESKDSYGRAVRRGDHFGKSLASESMMTWRGTRQLLLTALDELEGQIDRERKRQNAA